MITVLKHLLGLVKTWQYDKEWEKNKEVLCLEGSVPLLALRAQNENLVTYTNACWKCMGGQCSGKAGDGIGTMTERRQLL